MCRNLFIHDILKFCLLIFLTWLIRTSSGHYRYSNVDYRNAQTQLQIVTSTKRKQKKTKENKQTKKP